MNDVDQAVMCEDSGIKIIREFIINSGAKIYGDRIIGYRAQLENGEYCDSEFERIYIENFGDSKCSEFNDFCEELKTGCHNW